MKAGLSKFQIQLYDPEFSSTDMTFDVREMIDGESVVALVYGELAKGSEIIRIGNSNAYHDQRYVPATSEFAGDDDGLDSSDM